MGTRTERDGVAPGTYRVVILDGCTGPGPESPGKEFVDARFASFQTSWVQFQLPEQTDWQIRVKSPAKPRAAQLR
jgi:hypothetical protein